MKTPGITVRPIYNLYGGHDFNEVTFDDAVVADDMIVGGEGRGWEMVTGELAYERSGPDRFMSSYPLLTAAIDELGAKPQDLAAAEVGRELSQMQSPSYSLRGGTREILRGMIARGLGMR
jgi:alkylation response protein AidB-like acyl-CoA dehydrogenase